MKFCPEIEKNDEKILKATQDEVSALKKGQECANIKTDVKFENTIDCYVKFRSEIEKNDEEILEATQDEVSAPKKGKKCAKMKTDVKFENTIVS